MHRLERLLRPRSIAVFGGSFAANVVNQCRKMEYAGEVWPIHPTKTDVHGVKAYRGVEDLPGVPDAAFIGVNRLLTIAIVRQLRELGAGGAICFAAGFLEAGADDADGARLQDELLSAAGNMPIIGPNCYGLINYADGALLWPDQHGGIRLSGERGVAILTQSSNIAINMTMQKRGLPIAYVMTAGNQAQTGLSELALGLIEDERVSALGLHIEGFDSVAGFERLAARSRELRKPIVAMKVGRSEQARAGALSHTASLAGSDAASDAFLRRIGIARVDSIPAFLETLKLLHVIGPLTGNRLSSMSCSGGEASVMADSVEQRGLAFPPLDEAHRRRVKETLGPLVAVANPLDYNTFIWNNEEAMRETFSAMVSDIFDLNMLVLDFPRSDRCSDADWQPTLRAFEYALAAGSARGAVVASMPENMPEHEAQALVSRGIVPLFGIEEAMEAMQAARLISETWARSPSAPIGETIGKLEGTKILLDEANAKALLQEHGLNVPAGSMVSSIESAVQAAESLGFPVALKALGVAHKSDLGAVRLNLASADHVEIAATELMPLGSGLYVEKMISGAVAELIVGITDDVQFGPVMTLGTGGILVELLHDSRTLLLPVSEKEIENALRSLKMFALLDGYRGRPNSDLSGAISAIAQIAEFAQSQRGSLEELDINPLMVCGEGKGAWIADALLVRRTQ